MKLTPRKNKPTPKIKPIPKKLYTEGLRHLPAAVRIAFSRHGPSLIAYGISYEEFQSVMNGRLPQILLKYDPHRENITGPRQLIVTSALNTAINLLKEQKRNHIMKGRLTREQPRVEINTPRRLLMRKEIEGAIRSALESRLTHGERIVMEKYLFKHGGKHGSAVKIAKSLGTTESAVRTMISRARKKLKDDPVLRELMGLSE